MVCASMQGRDAAPSDGEASPVAREEEGALVAWKEFSTHAKVGVRRKVYLKRGDTPQTGCELLSEAEWGRGRPLRGTQSAQGPQFTCPALVPESYSFNSSPLIWTHSEEGGKTRLRG